jgi:diguanylate cyclase (GGDEF)-like protein
MFGKRLDLSARGWARVILLSCLGTLVCILVAFIVDSFSFESGTWRWGTAPWNNVIIPLVLAPPFFLYLLSKLRELAVAHHELSIVASTDVLTSCLNRRAFTAMVDAYLERVVAQGAKREGALLIIDVDHFKNVNDSFGHECGDEALKIIAQAIKEVVREIDLVGRIGGEEFSVFLPGTDANRTQIVAERIRVAVSTLEFYPTGNRCDLSVSVGGATYDREATFSDLFRQADLRLYAAKQNGRNRVEIHNASARSARAVHAVH